MRNESPKEQQKRGKKRQTRLHQRGGGNNSLAFDTMKQNILKLQLHYKNTCHDGNRRRKHICEKKSIEAGFKLIQNGSWAKSVWKHVSKFWRSRGNDLCPYVQVLTSRGRSSKSNVEDRKLREGVYFVRSSTKYIGASPWRHYLYEISSILNSMCIAIGNQ